MRLGIFGAAVAVSIVGRDALGWFMSLLGASTSLGTSVLLPIVFYLYMFGTALPWALKSGLYALLPATCLLAVSATFVDVQNLLGT